jgi:zinc protease
MSGDPYRLRDAGRDGWQAGWPPIALGVVLVLAGVSLVAGQTSAPAADRALTAGVTETRLPNGLRVLTKEVHSAPVVSLSVWYRVGSRNEHNGITGISHLLEHMMFKGTQRYRVGEIARTLFLNGASFNANTYYDWTSYYETFAADRLELAIELEADRMVHSRIDKADLDSEMTVVRSELEGGENDPETLLRQAVTATAIQAHPYHWPVIGWRSDVEQMPREALLTYYKTHYGPNNATVVIVGDFETRRALDLVAKHFGPLAPIPPPPPVYTTEPEQRGERRVTVNQAGALPIVTLAYRVPAATSPDFYALDVLGTVLGDGRTSRLYQALVDTELASDVDAGAPSLRDPFLFFVTATARPGVAAPKLEAALLDEIERVREAPITAEELARAKRQIESSLAYQTESVTAQGRELGYWAMTDDWRYLTTYLDRIRALTPEAIQTVARKYFLADTRTVGHFVPTLGGPSPASPPQEAAARVERPGQGARAIPIPPPSKPPAVDRRITRFTLANGITVVVQENPTSPTLAIRASLPAGRVVDPQDKAGLATLTAGMLTRGTDARTALQFATLLEDVGASLSASADVVATMISGRAESRDFDRVMDLLAEMLQRPAFPAAELGRLKGEAQAQLAQARDDPDSAAERAFGRVIHAAGHPLRPLTFDEAEQAIERLTRDDLLAFHRRQYGPDRLILVVAGGVPAERVREAIEARFGAWPRNPQAEPPPALDVPLQATAERVLIPIPDKSQTAIVWGHAGGLRRGDPDFYATQVMNLVLGGGGALNSRLGTIIRDQLGLAYTIESFFDAGWYPGQFAIWLGTNPVNARKAIETMVGEVKRLRDRGITRRERDEAVAYLTGRFPLRLETNSGMADVLWAMEFYRLGADYLDRYGDYYRAVTVAQANDAAVKHLHPDRATLVIAGTEPGGAEH